ncbi:hypothetical protein PC41400_05775 [Paenibacillus chitinolyticus]|uniref:Uncharacterized protein n=1 Tax=Paenibacillus chitinolyticus TaxID=79263 RepID=A0A410WSD0_9BACL|nr:hypothetical protein [Paenibacillus chitinolyticus]MCY9588968.1 hypothetical protein [Paenibacillus chitinolyticus]MCY9595422.1 hypothetical protein [Paenibacillus chitinolyticus]QAV17197.1 hypothetical protein PC41400_05775 [Paenibacillus chitinolyticus]
MNARPCSARFKRAGLGTEPQVAGSRPCALRSAGARQHAVDHRHVRPSTALLGASRSTESEACCVKAPYAKLPRIVRLHIGRLYIGRLALAMCDAAPPGRVRLLTSDT